MTLDDSRAKRLFRDLDIPKQRRLAEKDEAFCGYHRCHVRIRVVSPWNERVGKRLALGECVSGAQVAV